MQAGQGDRPSPVGIDDEFGAKLVVFGGAILVVVYAVYLWLT